MRSIPKWVDKIQDSDKQEQCIYDLCFSPDGTQLIVASGNRVLVYDASDGGLVQPLKGHKDVVYCVSYAKNGQKFASGSADKSVIVWSNKLEGLLKYSHSDAVQCLAYNPLSHMLASCALSDFAFWSAEQKSVQKHKTPARINTCSWTTDGQYIALGLGNGLVSIRNKLGEEKVRIERPNNAPIWSLSWNPAPDTCDDLLCVTDWKQTLSFYTLSGRPVGKERNIGFDALRVAHFNSGDYLLVAGTNRSCVMYTRDGIRLGTVGEEQTGWVWGCAVHPTGNYVVFGCQDGTIAYYQLILSTVHGLYQARYAYREHMTDVIIQHLLTEQKVRIKCRDLIKKIAIYKHRLAVQLPERIVIYELHSSGDANDMHYKVKEKIQRTLECSLLVICAEHLVICQEKKVLSMTFAGVQEREWTFDSTIRYIKIIGGPARREGLILGLKAGQVWEVHLDNSFPVLKVTVSGSIRCLDLSHRKEKLAVIDDNGVLQVYNNKNMQLLYKEPNTSSVAWNSLYEDMVCFGGGGTGAHSTLCLKVRDFPAHRQRLSGAVVGLIGAKMFCLNGNCMLTVDLPLSAPMWQFIDRKMFADAHTVACLGITDGEWEDLAHAALETLDLNIARLAFIKLQDYSYLELIRDLQMAADQSKCASNIKLVINQSSKNVLFPGKERQRIGSPSKESMIGDICAYRGKFKEAARFYQKAGEEHKALNMYTDLRMFDLAQDYLGSGDNMNLIRQKADWAKNINEHKAAVEMYLSIGDTKSAIDILGEQGWTDQLIDVAKRLDPRNNTNTSSITSTHPDTNLNTDRASLLQIASHLRRLQQSQAAADVYRRLGDATSELKLHVDAGDWQRAFQLVTQQEQQGGGDIKSYRELVYAPYARWLAERDKFTQAQKAFHKAGRPDEAFQVLGQLTQNAVTECRYNDAGYYYWILSRQCLDLVTENISPQQRTDLLMKYQANERLAGIYYAYHALYRYLEEPFTSFMPEALFNIARFLMTETSNDIPLGISQFAILYCLSKQARKLGAHKLAKQLLDKIQTLRIPTKFQEQVEVATISARAKPYNDPDELLPMCYRCSTYNPLSSASNKCAHCGQRFVHSYVSFEILPLVEFQLDDDISDMEAVRLIETPRTDKMIEENENRGLYQLDISDTQQTLTLDDSANVLDPFVTRMTDLEGANAVLPVVANRQTLANMDSNTILICKWEFPLRFQYFRNLLPELQITMCHSCFKAFHVDDFELQILQKGYCPFCRATSKNTLNVDSTDDLLV